MALKKRLLVTHLWQFEFAVSHLKVGKTVADFSALRVFKGPLNPDPFSVTRNRESLF